jgi:hypothetical protein
MGRLQSHADALDFGHHYTKETFLEGHQLVIDMCDN